MIGLIRNLYDDYKDATDEQVISEIKNFIENEIDPEIRENPDVLKDEMIWPVDGDTTRMDIPIEWGESLGHIDAWRLGHLRFFYEYGNWNFEKTEKNIYIYSLCTSVICRVPYFVAPTLFSSVPIYQIT